MKKILTSIVGAVFLLGCSTLTQEQNDPNVTKNIEGVWIINNADSPKHFSNGYYKVICADQHRVLGIKDGILQGIHGGYVSFDGQVMVEKPRFQTGNGFLGKTFKFNVKPDGSSFLQTGIKGSGSFENLKQQWVKVGSANHNIEGVWMRKLNNGRVMIKMIVDNFWNWIVVDPETNNVTAALGGSYDYDGENYIETFHFKYGEAERIELDRKWQVVAELKEGNLLFHGKNDEGNDFTENWVKYDATSILSQKQDRPSTQQQNKQAADRSFEQRLKLAHKPFSHALFTYIKVNQGMEEEFLTLSQEWLKGYEKMAKQGVILDAGLAKARENSLGLDYQFWITTHTSADLDTIFNEELIQSFFDAGKYEDLKRKSDEVFVITGRQLNKLEDWTIAKDWNVDWETPDDDSRELIWAQNFMTPNSGREEDYLISEKVHTQPRHQARAYGNSQFLGWNLMKTVMGSGDYHKAPYMTLDLYNPKAKPLSNEDRNRLMAGLEPVPDNMVPNAQLRKMERVMFEEVVSIKWSEAWLVKEWEALSGKWRHDYANGGYRTKAVSLNKVVFENFNAEGTRTHRFENPMRLYKANGISFFNEIYKQGEYTAPYIIKDGKWYEQGRGIYSGNNWNPARFFIYKKVD